MGSFSGGDAGRTERGLICTWGGGERHSRREHSWAQGLEVDFVPWVEWVEMRLAEKVRVRLSGP